MRDEVAPRGLGAHRAQGLARQRQDGGAVGLLQGDLPGLGRFHRVGGADHEGVGRRPQHRELLHGLVGGPVLAEPDRVVAHDVDHGRAHQRGQADRGPGVVGEAEERAAIGAQAAVERHAVHGRRHAVLADAVMDVAAASVLGAEHLHAARAGVVGAREVRRAAHRLGHDRCEHLQHGLGRLARRGRLGALDRLALERADGGGELARRLPRLRALPLGTAPAGERGEPLLPGAAGLVAAPPDLLPPELDLGGHLEGARDPAIGVLGALDRLGVGDGAVALGGVLRGGAQRDVGAASHHGGRVGLARLAQRAVDVLGVVAVALKGGPARGLEAHHLVGAVGEAHGAVDGDAVVVEEHAELREPLHARERDRLVAHPLHEAAVARDHPGAVIDQLLAPARAQHLLGHGHAHGGGEALAERARGGLDARRVVDLRMAGGAGAPLAEVPDLIQRHVGIARQMQQRVEQHRAVAGRKHEAVAVGPVGMGCGELQVLGVKDGGHVGHPHRHPRMARVGLGHRVEGERADRARARPMLGMVAAKGLDVQRGGSWVARRARKVIAGRSGCSTFRHGPTLRARRRRDPPLGTLAFGTR